MPQKHIISKQDKEYGFLGFDHHSAVWQMVSTLQRNLLPPSSGQEGYTKDKTSRFLQTMVPTYQTRRCHNAQEPLMVTENVYLSTVSNSATSSN